MNIYEEVFSPEGAPEPPAGLRGKIMVAIRARERRILKIKMAISTAVFAVSAWVVYVGYTNFMDNLSRSGFLQFASLLVSDFSLATSNFSDFAFSMIEAFPVFSAAFLLTGLLFAVWSVAAFIDEAARVRAYASAS